MRTKKKPNLSYDLSEVLKEHKPYVKKGYANALSAIKMLDTTISTETKEIQVEIDRLERSKIKDDTVYKLLRSQLSQIKADYSMLPSKLREQIDLLSKSSFTITVFGRTTDKCSKRSSRVISLLEFCIEGVRLHG